MKAVFGVVAALVALVVMAAVIALVSYVSANNYGATVEASLKAERDNNKNILAQYQQKVQEAAQVPAMYAEDFGKVVRGAVEGRYGPDGSKAIVQWIKESNIEFDSSMYGKIQQLIESGRKDFEVGQTRMIDIRRQYDTQLGLFWRGFWLRMAGFPKVDLKEFQPIITDNVDTVYKNGKESAPLKLR